MVHEQEQRIVADAVGALLGSLEQPIHLRLRQEILAPLVGIRSSGI
jgi:hypothetical protein